MDNYGSDVCAVLVVMVTAAQRHQTTFRKEVAKSPRGPTTGLPSRGASPPPPRTHTRERRWRHMNRGVLAAVAAPDSCEYDEVTEVSATQSSEGGHSLLHSNTSLDVPSLSVQLQQIGGPPAVAPAALPESRQPPLGASTATAMTTAEEEKLEPKEDQGLSDIAGIGGPGQPMPLAHPAGMPSGDDDDDDDEEEDGQAPAPEGAYDPADYEHLSVTPEISELFSYITRYTPQAIELEHRLRPYIPDYIPAVGDIDAFIKIPPPDDKASMVGLEVLDEPSARQSDATVLDLQLRALAKHTTAKSMSVKTVENAEKNGKVIEKWVRDISELHRSKPPPTVHYSKRMPDIDSLMQEWPGELEEMLKEINLPTAALDVELSDYVDIICAVMDIPVYKSRVQSLHVLFTLYSVFKNSAHFRQLAEENYMDNEDSTADQLVL